MGRDLFDELVRHQERSARQNRRRSSRRSCPSCRRNCRSPRNCHRCRRPGWRRADDIEADDIGAAMAAPGEVARPRSRMPLAGTPPHGV